MRTKPSTLLSSWPAAMTPAVAVSRRRPPAAACSSAALVSRAISTSWTASPAGAPASGKGGSACGRAGSGVSRLRRGGISLGISAHNPLDQLSGGVARKVGEQGHAPAIRGNHARLRQPALQPGERGMCGGVPSQQVAQLIRRHPDAGLRMLTARIGAALDVHRRPQRGDGALCRIVVENGDVVYTRQRRQDLGALAFDYQRTQRPLDAPGGGVAVEGDDEEIAQVAGRAQIRDVAQVQQIEAAVGEDRALPGVLARGDDRRQPGEIVKRAHQPCTRVVTAAESSSGVLVAQPMRRTTRPAAMLASSAASAIVAPATNASVNVAATVSPARVGSATSERFEAGTCSGAGPLSERLMPSPPRAGRPPARLGSASSAAAARWAGAPAWVRRSWWLNRASIAMREAARPSRSRLGGPSSATTPARKTSAPSVRALTPGLVGPQGTVNWSAWSRMRPGPSREMRMGVPV